MQSCENLGSKHIALTDRCNRGLALTRSNYLKVGYCPTAVNFLQYRVGYRIVSGRKSKAEGHPAEWQQGQLIEVRIDSLSNSGDGVGRWQDRVVFVPDTVPGDRLLIRLMRVKPTYAHGKLHQLLEPAPDRVRPACIVADKCGGCQWQPVAYDRQLTEKQDQVIQALHRIGEFLDPPVQSILAAEPLAYRNKATYPLVRSSSGQVQAGYYRKGTHRVVNLNQCPVQDERLNPLLAQVKQDIQDRGWSIYDEERHRGKLRHLGLRIGKRTGEMLLTLVTTDWNLIGLDDQAQTWLSQYPNLVGVALNQNGDRTNAIFGSETRCIAGSSSLREEFSGLQFQIHPTTFFQINTDQAERLLEVILNELDLQGTETLLDAYCGIGTLTLPLANRVNQAIGLEVQPEAIAQAQVNAALNQIENVTFLEGSVETHLQQWAESSELPTPDVVVLDPPRKGCDPVVLDSLRSLHPSRIVYVSCNPTTLARDLKLLCQSGSYQLQTVQPIDLFPQTAHVECVAFLIS